MHGNFMDAMMQPIERSQAVIISMSGQYQKNDYFRAEAHYAFNVHVRSIEFFHKNIINLMVGYYFLSVNSSMSILINMNLVVQCQCCSKNSKWNIVLNWLLIQMSRFIWIYEKLSVTTNFEFTPRRFSSTNKTNCIINRDILFSFVDGSTKKTTSIHWKNCQYREKRRVN
jgi:hypothetical protein